MSDGPSPLARLARRSGIGSAPGAAFASRAHSLATAPNVAATGRRNQLAAMLADPSMRMLVALRAVPPGVIPARLQASRR